MGHDFSILPLLGLYDLGPILRALEHQGQRQGRIDG